MNKKFYLAIFICFMCIFPWNIKAESCLKEVSRYLTKEAYYIKTNYEVIDKSTYKDIKIGENETTFKIPRYEFNISIYNLTEELYLVITNSLSDITRTVNYSDTDNGTYSFIDDEFGQISKYTIDIYSSNADCLNKKLKTIKFTRPMYNAYSEYAYCKNSSNYYCQKFTKTKLNLKGNEDFLSKIKVNNDRRSEEIKKNEEPKERGIVDLIVDNWQMYLGIFIGTIFISIILVFVIKKRKSKKEWNV